MRQGGAGIALVGFGGRWAQAFQFGRHFAEMAVAMMLGMAALDGVFRAALVFLGLPVAAVRGPEISLLVMATTMTLPMVPLMRLRGHGWASIIEMSAAMVVPVIGAIPLFRHDSITGLSILPSGAICGYTCLVMIVAMLAVMVVRREEYAHVHGM